MLRFGVDHGRHERLVERRMSEPAHHTVLAPALRGGPGRRLGIFQRTFDRIVTFIVEPHGTIPFENPGQNGQRGHATNLGPRAPVSPDDQGDHEIGKKDGKNHPVEDGAPVQAPRFIFRDEDVEQQVFLQQIIDGKVEGGNGKNERLQSHERKRDRGVEEKVVKINGVVKRRGSGPLDRLAGGGTHERSIDPNPTETDHLGQIHRGAKIALEEPSEPERRDGGKSIHHFRGKFPVPDRIPDTLIALPVDHGRDECPERREDGENDEIVKDEKGVKLGGHMTLSGRLGAIPSPDQQSSENNGKNQVDQRHQRGRSNALDGRPRSRVPPEILPESRPNESQVVQVGQKYRNQRVRDNPDHGQEGYPYINHEALPAPCVFAER